MSVIVGGAFWTHPTHAQPHDKWLQSFSCQLDRVKAFAQHLEQRVYDLAQTGAESLLGRAIGESGNDGLCAAEAHLLRGTAQQLSGKLADAGTSLDEAVRLFRRHVVPTHPALTLALNNQGVQRFFVRRYPEAARAHEEALDARRRATPADDLQVAESLHNLADAYRYLGRPGQGLTAAYIEAIDIRVRRLGQDHRLVAESRQNLASAYESLNDHSSAARELREALRIQLGTTPRNAVAIAVLLGRQAAPHVIAGRYGEAEALYEQAVVTLRTGTAGERFALAAVLDDYAVNQLRQQKLADAHRLGSEALAVRRELASETHPTIARTLSTLAETAWQQGQADEALLQSRAATVITLQASALDQAARLRLQRHVRSIAAALETMPSVESSARMLDEGFRIAQHAVRGGTASTVRALAVRVAAKDDALKLLLKQIDDLDRHQEGLDQRLAQLAGSSGNASAIAFTALRREIEALASQRTSLLADVRGAFPDYDQLIRPQPLPLATTQAMLDTDEVLVLVQVGISEIYVWAVTRETAIVRRAALHPAELDVAVRRLRQGLAVEPSDTRRAREPLFDPAAAHDLHQALFGEVSGLIATKRRLLFVPSGALTSMPLHVLVRAKPTAPQPTRQNANLYRDIDWLVRHHVIAVLPSVESLATLRGKAEAADRRRPLLAFADPMGGAGRAVATTPAVKTSSAGITRGALRRRSAPALWDGTAAPLERLRSFLAAEPLPDTADEVRTVAASLGVAADDLFIGARATETNVKSADLDKYRVVYFATHGFVTGTFGVGEPSLALTAPGVASEVDDGLLTASEIATLKLDADLVVLSACDTAAGDAVGADGLSGLARAFLHAGARGLLVSHWSIDSADTKALMMDVFKAKQSPMRASTSAALQMAMLARITSAARGNPWAAYPGRWAPFVLVGAQ